MSSETKSPEEMAAFFNARVDGYDEHMRDALGDLFDPFYAAIAATVPAGDGPMEILDLGAGTGAEIAVILARDVPLPPRAFGLAVAAMTMHHFVHEVKRDLYARIRAALLLQNLAPGKEELYHIDIPFAIETQRRLLLEAGFSAVDVAWQDREKAILVAQIA